VHAGQQRVTSIGKYGVVWGLTVAGVRGCRFKGKFVYQ
jgi:hypothetical protein